MMYSRNAIILATSLALLVPNLARATGNVLLPNDNVDKSSLPNLGLVPAESEPAPVEAPKPAEVKKTETPAPPPAVIAAPPEVKPIATQPYPAYPEYPPAYPEPQPRGAYSIMVSMPKATWTPNDIDIVSTQLGLAKSEVTSKCVMGINGMLITDHGTSSVESKFTNSVKVTYDGLLNNAMLSIYAACDSAPKPAPYNYMQRMGDKFGVSLSSAFCQPKTPFAGTMHQIVINHTTNGNDNCIYQQ